MSRVLLERLSEYQSVQWAAALAVGARSSVFGLMGRSYRSLDDACWLARVSTAAALRAAARVRILDQCRGIVRDGVNPLVQAFRADPESESVGALYTITGRGKHELWRDTLVLKSATEGEKGVILLKYARTFGAIVALMDLERLMDRYTFVLEPCWAGLCIPSILLFLAHGNPVIVQCFTAEDHEFIASIGAPFVPVNLGPADWVDSEVFAPAAGIEKNYDVVMVANWAQHKRHSLLFRALQEIRDRDVRVLLIGFPWADRTANHIRREAAQFPNPRVKIEIRENVPPPQLAALVSQAKVFVFLSRKEGDNKALVEAMFVDVPSVVYEETVGGAGNRVNSQTGVFASDAELAGKIRYMLDNHRRFSARQWALEHSGSPVATRVLDDALRSAVRGAGGRYERGIVEKTNTPNLAYKNAAHRIAFQRDYEFIKSCLLPRWHA